MTVSKENLVHLQSFIESFEDHFISTPSQKIASYQQVKDILDSATTVNQDLLDSLLKACTSDLKPDVEYLPSVLNTVIAILKKKEKTVSQHVLSSAIAIVDIINAIASLKNIGALKIISLKKICFDSLLAYPDTALELLVAQEHEKILKIIEIYCSSVMTPECRVLAYHMLKRLLKTLSPESKQKLVTEGVDIWFLKVVPTVVLALAMNATYSVDLLEALELLTESLAYVDYADNTHWHLIVECIFNPQKYPTVMKNLLENHNEAWHRLWIVLIRLLKEQVTKVPNKTGSPVNSMLPVVEQAYKMDIDSRILAYRCWEVLIDSFASERSEAFVMKRLNLLTIPLKSPNAKVEQTAKAKINAWWHLIRMYHSHMGKLTNQVLLPFVHCCFGHPEKSLIVPGLFSPDLTTKCIEMLVEIFGHVNCAGCVTVPKLKSRLINLDILMNNWKEWLHALKIAIKFSALKESDGMTQQLSCLWQSLLLTFAELPEGESRSAMLGNLLDEVELLLKCNSISEKLADNIFNVMIVSIFNRESESILMLFKTNRVAENDPIVRILKIILDPTMENVLTKKTAKDLKPIANALLDKTLFSPNMMVEWLQQNLPEGENSVVIWCALAESISQCYFEFSESVTHDLLMWPLLHQTSLLSERSANVYVIWKTLFCSWLNKCGYDKILSTLLIAPTNSAPPATDLKMCVALVLLKHLFLRKHNYGIELSTFALRKLLTNNVTCYKDMEKTFPMVIDTLSAVITRLTRDVNVVQAEKMLFVLHLVMRLTMQDELPSNDIKRYLLKPLNEMFKVKDYFMLKNIVVDDLIKYLSTDKHTILKTNVLDTLKTFLFITKGVDIEFHEKVRAAIESADDNTNAFDKMVGKLARAESVKTTHIVTPALTGQQSTVSEIYSISEIVDANKLGTPASIKMHVDTPKTIPAHLTKHIIIENLLDDKNLPSDKSDPATPEIATDKDVQKPKAKKKVVTPKNTPVKRNKKPAVEKTNSAEPNVKSTENQMTAINDFALPITAEPIKKSKKKEPTIVNTVVENGEEYAVVKSHWKFNPRKLTDHQKEKLKRKREDIPALYQDLSQSQDEMKLSTWKTDSQDSSTTTSKSNSNSTSSKDFSGILKNLPSSNVVPKIIENILSDKDEKVNHKNSNNKPDETEKPPKVKTPKTPRMALKDRVFRNVRNLMEKSGLQDSPTISTDLIMDENIRTPPTKKNLMSDNIMYSAPSKISSDRPTRLIKKPKKFEDSKLFSLKRRQRSVSDSQSDIGVESIVVSSPEETNDASPDIPAPSNNEIEDTQVLQINDVGKLCNTQNPRLEETLNENMLPAVTVTNDNDGVNVDDIVDNNITDTRNSNTSKISTPKPKISKKRVDDYTKKCRIEKQLLIDMVEGHPFLKTKPRRGHTKRNTGMTVKQRKSIDNQSNHKKQSKSNSKSENDVTECTSIEKNNKEPITQTRKTISRTSNKKIKNRDLSNKTASVTVMDSQTSQEKLPSCTAPCQEKPPTSALSPKEQSLTSSVSSTTSVSSCDKSSPSTISSQDIASSEDIIESSQDSSVTTISVKSSKTVKLVHTVNSDDCVIPNKIKKINLSQDLLGQFDDDVICLSESIIEKSNEDIELPKNKSVAQDVSENNLTENMDTEPFEEQQLSDADDCVIIINENTPIVIGTETVGTETQDIAEADTEPFETESITHAQVHASSEISFDKNTNNADLQNGNLDTNTPEDLTQTLPDNETVSSPFKDDGQKNKEFLNNTLEISPIKTLSPIRDKKSPSPETSDDYVVITLTSPVQSNGEPFNDKCDSPEIFTEDKTSPEKLNQSPPREEVKITNTSPSSSLSLKKNKSKVARSSGRAAQIMGLCGPENTTIDIETYEREELKKSSPQTTQARRNLKIMYVQNSVNDVENVEKDDDEENFLKFIRPVPSAECSPSGPILKRKLTDITDDTTVSPASKRKRVSFHDPPVSTTVSVQKYLEPCGTRSPQSSAAKRQERLARGFTGMRSQKRLDHIFKLDSVLTKAIESFSNEVPATSDSEMSSIEQTPAAEVVMTSDLNNSDPISPELLDCNDPISNIAGDLSSPAMKDLLIKELAGKVETVADLAKLTELEVNRLCIKAPKVKVAKQVLTAYAAMRNITLNETRFSTTESSITSVDKSNKYTEKEIQTIPTSTKDNEMQTAPTPVTCVSSQTNIIQVLDMASQTNETGAKSTEDIVASCIADRPDFVEQLGKQLREPDLHGVASNLSFNASLDVLMSKTNSTNKDAVINRLLNDQITVSSSNDIEQFTDYLCKRFQYKDLILLCSKILQNVHENDKKS